MRIAAVVAAVVLALNASSSAPTAAEPTTVIVELFTSEGCSDCPPADVLLQRLIDASPVPGAQVIGLGQHVDYWDRQGWRDRFSSGAFTARQRIYAARFANASIYTPQMVVDGRAELVGSDAAAARKAIERAAAASHGVVRIEIEPGSANKLAVSVAARDLPHEGRGDRADLFVAVTEDRLRSEVTRGENHGRTLAHAAVVRYLASIGEAASETAAARADIPIGSDWRRENLKVVAFVQARRDRTIVASAALPLSRGAR